MSEYKMFTAKVSYEVDIMLPLTADGKPDSRPIMNTMSQFGARHELVDLVPYTGKGEHEFVGSKDPGLQHLSICVKCSQRRDKATENCPGVLS